jgi:hypothetical protein
MRSSMPLEVILLLYFFVCAFVVKARVESDEERERENGSRRRRIFSSFEI